MTPEQLKASILQYAIQGKLVEQRPEEGTAEDLYKAIQEEKQKLPGLLKIWPGIVTYHLCYIPLVKISHNCS